MLIRDAIISPGSIQYWEELQWDIFIQQGYVTELLARLYFIFERNNVLDYIPEYVMHHFTSSTIFFQAHLDDVQREVSIINQALQPSGIIPVFLKGTAYIVNKDQAYLGRLFSDIDILVSKTR